MERTQHGLPLATVLCAAAALLLASPPAAAAPKPGYTAAMKLRQNTVRIKAHFGDQLENGFGFLVGQNAAGALYAVTAYHVVSNPDDVTGEQPVKLEVELYDFQGEPLEAKLLGTHDDSHDLAVITFPAPQGFEWNKAVLGSAEHLNALTEVWFVGKSRQWTVPTSPGTIASEAPEDARIDIENLDVRPGSSGGPLIASSGIVGMVVEDSADGAKALTIDFIKTKLGRWNHPFQLQNSTPATPVRTEPANPDDEMVARGALIAAREPLAAALREQQPEGPTRRGFDLGMAAAEGQTLWGPGKQAKLDALPPAEREGFRAATYFSVARNANILLAETGAAIAEVDPLVAKARMREPDALYWLGFDIATGLFGDPKRGAKGNTATGPGSLGIRDALLSTAAKRGFNASVAFHLARRY